jgi:phenylpyruvate tautomerase PptA (4-oxalocrotonate tautomerase family)
MFIKMLQENSEMKNIIIEQNKHIGELIPKVGNNNNNTINNHFNLNFFLNEQCKEAITMDEFINKMNISLTNLFYTKKKGIAQGISNIFIENLNKLPLNQRPIHCTDVKRETIYIKNQQWEKDENKTQTKDAIKKVSYLQIKNIRLFKESKPNLMENQKDKEDYMELIKATTDSIENKEDKVIKNICKNIYIKNDLLE